MAEHTFEVQDGVGVLTLNRPEVLNALTLELYAQLLDRLERLDSEPQVKALVLTGAGRAFCSGGDVHQIIGELLDQDMRAHLEFTRLTGAVVRAMRLLGKPILAAVNGIAAGAGAVIALASDLRVVAESAEFAFLFTKVGLAGADMGAAYLLPRVVGMGLATEILFTGEKIDANRAERIGLANRVVPDGQALAVALDWAKQLAAGPGLALATTKRMLEGEWTMGLLAALESEAHAQALMLMGADHRAFYGAFKQKKPPRFEGR